MNRRLFLLGACALMPAFHAVASRAVPQNLDTNARLRTVWRYDADGHKVRTVRMRNLNVGDIFAMEDQCDPSGYATNTLGGFWMVATSQPRVLPNGVWEISAVAYEETPV